jgi:hypothetical protein
MSIWRKFFSQSKIPLEERRDGFEVDGMLRVSCMDIVRIIKDNVSNFKRSEGMVVVLLEVYRVQIYLFDGIAHTSWDYTNQIFSTDMVGKVFLLGPPIVLALSTKAETLLPVVLQREFAEYDMNIGKLWKLNPNAWDYETMKVLHGSDVSIRISFDKIFRI